MKNRQRFTSIKFKNFKAFDQYSVALREFNVLVGPNNSGKSTIIGAFRILAEGLRRARTRLPSLSRIRGSEMWSYDVPLEDLPISTENVFTDYDDSEPATVEFRISNGNRLLLIFPEVGVCYLTCRTEGRLVRTTSDFKRGYPVTVGFVPVLGPVEHNEPLYKKEAARLALLTHRASRNFRNIWYHYPDNFSEFRESVCTTWPGMDIEPPEIDLSHEKTMLRMFCHEDRISREIFWAGFGFQVWCQMLTYIMRAKDNSLLIIDEADIYLHSDLQRQLIGILKALGPDVLIATHSTEIICEAAPEDLLVVDKESHSAKRLKDPSQLQDIFSVLGSNLNPTLTQLARTKRALFVEGRDFLILSLFARKLGRHAVANRSDFAVIPVEGFNPWKVRAFSEGMERTLGVSIIKGVIFDRDYRSQNEVDEVETELSRISSLAYIHKCKEIENYLLHAPAIRRAIQQRLDEQNRRKGTSVSFDEDVVDIIHTITDPLKNHISAQFLSKRFSYEKSKNPSLDTATINETILSEFENRWNKISERVLILPGKEVLAALNNYLQSSYGVNISVRAIVNVMKTEEIPGVLVDLIEKLDVFRKEITP